jgi:hypothetical protein
VKIRNAAKRPYSAGGVVRYQVRLLERLLGLDRQPDGYFLRAVEYLKNLIADQATELAFRPPAGRQFNPTITGVALRADNIRLSHAQNMRSPQRVFHPEVCHNQTEPPSKRR